MKDPVEVCLPCPVLSAISQSLPVIPRALMHNDILQLYNETSKMHYLFAAAVFTQIHRKSRQVRASTGQGVAAAGGCAPAFLYLCVCGVGG